MGSIQQYIKRVGHLADDQLAFNEVDILLMNELTYLVAPDTLTDLALPITLPKFYQSCRKSYQALRDWNPFLFTRIRYELLSLMANCRRYQTLEIKACESQIDTVRVTQFVAVTYSWTDHVDLIVYKGTDDSLIGWREDFNMASQSRVPAQISALDYLSQSIAKDRDKGFIVSGHSKGGNLAIYAVGMLKEKLQPAIKAIYAFDNPGFQVETKAQIQASGIAALIQQYCPEDAIIGQILVPVTQPHIVASNKKGFFQHDISNWQVDQFQLQKISDFSEQSQRLKQVMDQWLDTHDLAQRANFFDMFFDLLEKSQLNSLNDLNHNALKFIGLYLQQLNELEDSNKQILIENLQNLIGHYRELAREDRLQQQALLFEGISQRLREFEISRKR